MDIIIIPHAWERMSQRGALYEEVVETVKNGVRYSAKYGRNGYCLKFRNERGPRRSGYDMKKLKVYAVDENSTVVVITVIVKYF